MSLEEEIRKISESDQTAAGFSEFAQVLKSYYDDLCASGFSKGDALRLTIEFQNVQALRAGRERPND